MNRIRRRIDEFQMLFDRLSGREKILVLIVAGGMLTFIVAVVVIGINISLVKLKDRLETSRDNYERIVSLKEHYIEANANIERVRNEIGANKEHLLNTAIGTLAKENNISIAQISSSGGGVDKKANVKEVSFKVQLRRVELPPLIQFLEGIEKENKLFFLRSINMRRQFSKKAEMDISFNVSTLVPLEEEG